MSLCQIDVRITRNLLIILSIFLPLFIIVRSFPLGEAEKVQLQEREREKRGSTPCFSHSDCLRNQLCTWNVVVVDLVGSCVTVSHQQLYDNKDQRYQINKKRPGRGRREVLSFDDVDDGKAYRRQARNTDSGAERRGGSGGERWINDHPNGEVANIDISKEDVEATEDNEDYVGDLQNDKQSMQSQLSRRVPQASYPLPHKLLDQNTYHRGDDNDNDEVVIDHFDDKGLPVVIISEDNRDQHAEIDTSKDFYTFGEETGDNGPDTTNAKTESTFYDYEDGSEVVDGGYDGERVVIDLKGGRIRPGIQSIFSNPWGLQPIRAIPRPVEDMVDDDNDEYFNDDVQVYGVGDNGQVKPRFRHTDLDGTGIETDVGVRDQRPAPRLAAADQTGYALPGLLKKDWEAHNY